MWFKKKSQISGYNSNMAYDGTDWRATQKGNSWPVSQTLPSAADANKYFYLPALGFYTSGQLVYISNYGFYWSSSACPGISDDAYDLYFDSGNVNVYNGYRHNGARVDGFQ